MSTVQVLNKGKPLLPVINIQRNNGSTYVWDHFNGTRDFGLRYLTCRPPFDSVGGTFEMKLSHVNQSTLNTILNNIEEGNEVEISIGKTSATKKKVFLGTIEEIETEEWSRKWMDVVLRGPDWGSDLLRGRVVNGYWEREKLSDGETPDPADTSTETSNLRKLLLQDPNAYLVPDIAADDMGLVVNPANIQTSGVYLSQFASNGETLNDKLGELDAEDGQVHWVDPDKNFHSKAATITDPGILITDDYKDSVIQNNSWPLDKIGFISIRRPFVTVGSVAHHGRRLLGVGGDQRSIDQKQETTSSSDPLHTLHRAVKFQPVQRVCPLLGVFLSKSGTPPDNVVVELREDFGNRPTGDVLRSLVIAKAALVASPGKWHYLQIGEELNTAKSYWVVVSKLGTAGNTANWHKGGAGYDTSTSADDVTWGAPSSGAGYAFRQYYSSPILSVAQTIPLTASSKHFRERLYRKPSITDRATMYQLLRNEAATAFRKKQMLRFLVYAPTILIEQGQKIRVRKQRSGRTFDADFVVASPEYIFEAGTKTLYQELTMSRFIPYA